MNTDEGVSNTVLIMAGGTGGHVFPGLALAKELLARGYHVEWLGTQRGLEFSLVPAAGIRLNEIFIEGIRGKGWRSIVMAPWQLSRAIAQAIAILRRLKPKVVVGLGGFVSGPGAVAAKMCGLPLIVHEQNARAGTTNRWLARAANKVLLAFPDVLPGGQTIGNPVRKELAEIKPPQERLLGREGPIKILVIGGSRGARAINKLIPAALAKLHDKSGVEVWHQTGAQLHEETLALYRGFQLETQAHMQAQIRVQAFIDDMAEAYKWADVVICRSGALTVSELAQVGIAALLIPFPFAIDDHQMANAEFLTESGAAWAFRQEAIDADTLVEIIEEKLLDRTLLNNMAIKSREKALPNACRDFADACEEYLRG